MNDIGTMGFIGFLAQWALASAALMLWQMRRTRDVALPQALLLAAGGFAFLFTIAIPASDLLRTGIGFIPECVDLPECRADLAFTAKWIGLAVAALAVQFAFFIASAGKRLSRRRDTDSGLDGPDHRSE